MTADIAWAQLEAAPPQATPLVYIPLGGAGPARLLAGLRRVPDGSRERLLLLQLPRAIARRLSSTERHHGLRLESIADDFDKQQGFVSLVLAESALRDIFSVLCADILDAVAPVAEPADQLRALLTRLERWQELFSQFNPEGLGQNTRQGLWGELWAMRWLLTEGALPPATVLAAWAGPDRHPQDFRFSGTALEIKTTTGNSRTLHIASLQQLEDALTGPLFLLHLPLLADQPAAENLPALVTDLAARFAAAGPAMVTRFGLRLQTVGYFDSQANLYQEEKWQVADTRLLAVRGDDFPRLRTSQLPAAFTAATYDLDAPALEPWRCPPTDLFTLLS
jgi:hypothetical protein